MEDQLLEKEKISSLLIKYVVPAVIAMIIAGSQTMIDGMFVGNYVGANGLASINVAQPFMSILTGMAMIISVGGMSFIGRKLGENRRDEAEDIFKTAWVTLFILSSLMAIGGICFKDVIARMLGASPLLKESVATYIGTILLFAPIMCLYFLFGFIDRLLDRPELYLVATIISVTFNIIGDFILVKLLKLGVAGAAFATGFAYVAPFFIVILPLLKKSSVVNLWKGQFRWRALGTMVYNGSSEAMISISLAATTFIFNQTFMREVGEMGIAAFTIINYIGQLGMMMMFGISDGISPIISYNYGAGHKKRVHQTLYLAIKISIVIGIILFAVIFFGGENLINLFMSEGGAAVDLAVQGSKLYALTFIISGINIISSGFLTSIGDARGSIIISLSRGIVGVVIVIMILPAFLGLTGVWLTIPVVEGITLLISKKLVPKI